MPDAISSIRNSQISQVPGTCLLFRLFGIVKLVKCPAPVFPAPVFEMFGMFAAFAIFVAILGLFGLASFTTERRTKEIGVRKVMGATVRDIVLLLTSDFTKLVLIANILAWPVAFYFMRDWLNRFVYKAPFSDWAWLFVAAGVVALVAAWITIALQASRAARSRPVLALRYE